jgi:SAM-dependent methyltransferase
MDDQAELNAARWVRGDYVAFYATNELRAAEAVLLDRRRDVLRGRVLELGCGAGRLTGHLCELAQAVHGLELSPSMAAYCRQAYPQAVVSVGDLRDLSRFESGTFEAVFAPFNVLDVLGDGDRRLVLEQIRRLLTEDGLLLMSSHNRGLSTSIRLTVRSYIGSLRHPFASARGLVRRLRNRRRMRPLEREEEEYALVNDQAHDYSLLHYYISRDAQARQFAEHGFELIECLDLEGREVVEGESAAHCAELHYVARLAGS